MREVYQEELHTKYFNLNIVDGQIVARVHRLNEGALTEVHAIIADLQVVQVKSRRRTIWRVIHRDSGPENNVMRV